MTAESQVFALGQRFACAFTLDPATGLIKPTSTAVYEGLELTGNKSLALTVPTPREFTHMGQDRPLAIDFLPANQAISGDFSASAEDLDAQAMFGGIKKVTVGQAVGTPLGHSNSGNEPQVGLFFYQMAEAFDTGQRRWRTVIFPTCKSIYLSSGMGEQTEDVKYRIAPNISKYHLWGAPYDFATEGVKSAQAEQLFSVGIPHLVAWLADGTATAFDLNTDHPARDGATGVLWINGTIDSTAAWTTTDVTPTTKPSDKDVLIGWYEE